MALVDADEVTDPGLYTGLAGIAFVLERMHHTSGEARFRAGAIRCIDRIVSAARVDRGGVGWGTGSMDEASSDIVSGAAGIGLTLLWARDTLEHARAGEVALAAGERLTVLSEPAPGGRMWRLSPSFDRNYPNFSHGTGGVAFFLARLAEEEGGGDFLEAAREGAGYLETVGRCNDEGCAVFHHEPGGEDLFYLSWCHGPAGTARLFHVLGRISGEARWTRWIGRGAEAIRSFGVPEERSPGYWNNISQCCGDAGVGEFFLALERHTGERAHGDYAERIGDWILSHATGDEDELRWVQAENRVSPEDVSAQSGWMQGAAGVAAFFLHLDGRRVGRENLVELPDSPW
jgi:lantibiotic modifying enzyme